MTDIKDYIKKENVTKKRTFPKGGMINLLKDRIAELEAQVQELQTKLIETPTVVMNNSPLKTKGIINKINTRRRLRRVIETAT